MFVSHVNCTLYTSMAVYSVLWSYSSHLFLLLPFKNLSCNFKWITIWSFYIWIQWTLVIFYSFPSLFPSYRSLVSPLKIFPHLYSCLIFSLDLVSAYERKRAVFVFLRLAYFANHDDLWFHTFSCKWHNFILLYSWRILQSIYMPQFHYSFICWWSPRLIPQNGYC
jgi:hypothetical protein